MRRISAALLLVLLWFTPVHAETKTILALGDSLTAGLGLAAEQAFPARLEAALAAKGHNVKVINAGVSGDTAADGLARLDWALTEDVDGVIVELGANDALRGLDPKQAEAALDAILVRLAERKLPVLLAGMRAPPNMGSDYAAMFDGMYQRLVKKHGVQLFPFFLEGVAANASLNQADGIHPNAEGVDVIVTNILPMVEQLVSALK